MKRPERMTAEERLARIRSLERRLQVAQRERDWAQRDEVSTRRWAEQAWQEVRRLHVVIEHHWEVRQEARRLLGLDDEARAVEIARFDYDTRSWVPAHPEVDFP